MTNEIYTLFRETLPEIIRNPHTVEEIISDKANHIIFVRESDYTNSVGNNMLPTEFLSPENLSATNKLIAVSIIRENVIYLLCVDINYQNHGIGTKLLRQSEEYITANGYDKVIVGAGNNYIMPGIPMNNGAHKFFAKHGYTHSWGDEGCFDMSQNLNDFECANISIGDTINGITYRWAASRDLCNITKCVADAHEDFVQYYQDTKLYEPGGKISVLVAEAGEEICGTLMVAQDTEGEGLGSVGCTATMHKHREKGIAGTLVKLGTKHLKEIGLKKAFLGYTYTYILNIYRRAGYEVCMEYFMGEKPL